MARKAREVREVREGEEVRDVEKIREITLLLTHATCCAVLSWAAQQNSE